MEGPAKMAKQQRPKYGNPQRRQAPATPKLNSDSRTARKQRELIQEQRRTKSGRSKAAQILVGVLAAIVILGTIFGTLSSLALT